MAAKQKKKRTKRYQGADAKVQKPLVTRVSAEERSRLKEWWLSYGQLVRIVGAIVAVVFVVILLVVGIIGMF